jgi:putative 4-mercaptohistidine N1-methyltranferase
MLASMPNPYESERLVSEYLFFHYADEADWRADGIPLPERALGFASRVVSELLAPPPAEVASALDTGCATGRSSFELARHAGTVLGIDYSAAFISAAERMKSPAGIETTISLEGKRTRPFHAKPPADGDPSRLTFATGDATALPSNLGPFDIVLAANLVCRLPDPAAFLADLPRLVKPGGQLLLATPFTWLEEFTPSSAWLGARPDGPTSREALAAALEPSFILEFSTDLPFLIREHSRKYQYTISLGTRWRRR